MPDLLDSAFSYWSRGGWLLLPLAVVSVAIWTYFLRSREIVMRLRRRQDVFLGRMVELVRQDVEHGMDPFAAFSHREAGVLGFVKKDFVVLAALTAVAPLIGLLGTVTGMVATFDAVAAAGGDTGTRVAGGISQALITTQVGLMIALPGLFSLARLQRAVRNLQGAIGQCRAKWIAELQA